MAAAMPTPVLGLACLHHADEGGEVAVMQLLLHWRRAGRAERRLRGQRWLSHRIRWLDAGPWQPRRLKLLLKSILRARRVLVSFLFDFAMS